MRKMSALIIFSVLILSTVSVYGDDSVGNWPTWRGIDCMGISPDGDPPIKWSESENIKWKVPLTGDNSNSTPIVWGDKLIFQSAVKTEKIGKRTKAAKPSGRLSGPAPKTLYKFNLVCVDRKTGKTQWEKTVVEMMPHQGHHVDHGFASFSPVTDGKYIWANYGSRGVYCYDMNGERIWGKKKPEMNSPFGEGGSIAIAGKAVIVVADQVDGSKIYAYNKKTGDILWEKKRDEPEITYATPLPVEVNGKDQVIVNAWNKICSYDPNNGDVIWECGGPQRNGIYSPVVKDGVVYCVTQVDTHTMQAIKLGKTGDITGTDAIVWQNKNAGTPDIPSLLLYKNRLYSFSGFEEKISCYNPATGKAYFEKQRLNEMNKVYASPVATAGRIYCVGRNGVSYVLKASDKLEVLSINKLDDEIDCSPVVVGKELYLKGKKYLYCIAESK